MIKDEERTVYINTVNEMMDKLIETVVQGAETAESEADAQALYERECEKFNEELIKFFERIYEERGGDKVATNLMELSIFRSFSLNWEIGKKEEELYLKLGEVAEKRGWG